MLRGAARRTAITRQRRGSRLTCRAGSALVRCDLAYTCMKQPTPAAHEQVRGQHGERRCFTRTDSESCCQFRDAFLRFIPAVFDRLVSLPHDAAPQPIDSAAPQRGAHCLHKATVFTVPADAVQRKQIVSVRPAVAVYAGSRGPADVQPIDSTRDNGQGGTAPALWHTPVHRVQSLRPTPTTRLSPCSRMIRQNSLRAGPRRTMSARGATLYASVDSRCYVKG